MGVTLGADESELLYVRSHLVLAPAQVPVVNDVFTPSADELARANDLVADVERAQAAGIGVVIDQNGRMVDEAVVRQARRLLQRRR